MSRAAVPYMTDGGVIVNISSFGAREPSASFPVSSVIRAGLSAFTSLFAKEYGDRNIRMINLLPGYFETYPIDNNVADSIPLGRAGTLEEIAGTVAFLCSPEAGYISGTDITVDCGMITAI